MHFSYWSFFITITNVLLIIGIIYVFIRLVSHFNTTRSRIDELEKKMEQLLNKEQD
jgi:large-conductance mechanosensitive channel